jgi:hypothetical protein
MYVLSGSNFIWRNEHGETMVDTRATPDFVLARVSYSTGTPRHTIENTGDDELHVIGVELKKPSEVDRSRVGGASVTPPGAGSPRSARRS